MAGLVPATHGLFAAPKAWMSGTSPGMTEERWFNLTGSRFSARSRAMHNERGYEISLCTERDYMQILDELSEFWDGRDSRHLHHPFLVREFGNSAFVVRDGLKVV